METMNRKTNLMLLASLVASSVLATACGMQTDPTTDYKDITAVARETRPVPGQKIEREAPRPNFFAKWITPGLVFVDGQEGVHTLDLPVDYADGEYQIVASGIEGLELRQVEGSKYEIRWTPQGVTRKNDSVSLVLALTVQASNFKDQRAAERYEAANKTRHLVVVVNAPRGGEAADAQADDQ